MSESDREKSKASATDERPEDDGKESIWRRWRRDERSARPPVEKAEGESPRKKAGEQGKRPIDKKPKRAKDEELDDEKERIWDRLEGLVPDVLKRTIVGSIGSLMLSEDGLRQYLAELKLPKEVVGFILQHADNTKREFMRLIAREIREFLENTNFYDEIRTILTGLSFEIRTEIRLIPNEQQFVKPEISNRFKVKRKGPNGAEEVFDSENEPPSTRPRDAAQSDGAPGEQSGASKRKAGRRPVQDSAPEPPPEAIESERRTLQPHESSTRVGSREPANAVNSAAPSSKSKAHEGQSMLASPRAVSTSDERPPPSTVPTPQDSDSEPSSSS